MTPHRLDIAGDDCLCDPWYCVDCGQTFRYAVDGRAECGLSWPWTPPRVEAFRARVRGAA